MLQYKKMTMIAVAAALLPTAVAEAEKTRAEAHKSCRTGEQWILR
jgi:hypothetical protein